MTSSATPTEEKPEPRDEGDADRVGRMPEPMLRWLGRIAVLVLLVIGWFLIFRVNRWHFGPPVVFLSLGWLAVLLTARHLLLAGWMAANDDPGELGDFWQPVGAREELEREKRSLLKAIKEIEFDHEMGKMSDEDAEELIHFYRARAIEVIKALDVGGPEEGLTVQQRIDREVRARLAVSGKPEGRGAARPAATAGGASAAEAVPERGAAEEESRAAAADYRAEAKSAEAESAAEAKSAAAESAAEAKSAAAERAAEAESAAAAESAAQTAATAATAVTAALDDVPVPATEAAAAETAEEKTP